MYLKIRLLICLSFCVCVGMTYAAEDIRVIQDIRVEGNTTVSKRTVISKVSVKKGDIYSDTALQESIQGIYALNLFEDVLLRVDDVPSRKEGDLPGVIITFEVKEKRIIKKIELIGNKKISRSKILEDITSEKGESFDSSQLQVDAQTIELLYKDKGYANAKVEPYSVYDEKSGKQIVTFYIEEGQRILINKVTIHGTKRFSSKKILRKMKTRRKKVFKQDVLEEDVRTIEVYYKNKGYVKVNISEPEVTYNEEQTEIYVTVTIDEGMPYRVGSISFAGNSVYTDQELLKLVKIKKENIFNQEKFDETLQGIQELYADKGYLRMKINTREITEDTAGRVDFTLEMIEGGVVYVDRVYVEGNTYTKEKVIRREILLAEGEPFSAQKVRRSIERIMNLGFLDDVQIDIQQPEAIDRADVVFEVKEGKPGMLTAGAGFSSVDGLLGTLQVSHINMFGRAQRLNLMWEFGERRQSYDISYTEPWFMDKPVSVGVNFFDVTRKRQYGTDYSAYRERRRGGNLQVGPRLTDKLSLNFTYSFEQINIFDIDPQYANVIRSGRQNQSSVISSISYDTRDSIFDPTRGHQESLSVQVSGGPFGGDVHFYKPIVRGSYHLNTFWKFVLSLSGRVGYVESFAPSSDDDIFYEKFYVGGGESVRGYDYRGEIGPTEGGRMMSVFNLEYGFPLVQEHRRTILQFAVFADMGGAWSDPKDVSFKIGTPERYLKSGAGFGLRFKTPVFPIRLDWGYGFNHRPGEDLSQFYFTIGNVF